MNDVDGTVLVTGMGAAFDNYVVSGADLEVIDRSSRLSARVVAGLNIDTSNRQTPANITDIVGWSVDAALSDACLTSSDDIAETAMVFDRCVGSMNAAAAFLEPIFSNGLRRASPARFPHTVAHAPIAITALRRRFNALQLQTMGGGHLLIAHSLISAGYVARVLVGGFDERASLIDDALSDLQPRDPSPSPIKGGAATALVLESSLIANLRHPTRYYGRLHSVEQITSQDCDVLNSGAWGQISCAEIAETISLAVVRAGSEILDISAIVSSCGISGELYDAERCALDQLKLAHVPIARTQSYCEDLKAAGSTLAIAMAARRCLLPRQNRHAEARVLAISFDPHGGLTVSVFGP